MPRRKPQEISLYTVGGVPVPIGDGDLELALRGEVGRAILGTTHAQANGQIARVRIQEAEATADLALEAVAAISRKEARCIRESPHAVYRFLAIGDALGDLTASEVRSLRRS